MATETKVYVLVATDFDGTFGEDTVPMPPSEPTLVISGRTFKEYNGDIRDVAKDMPVYIRGSGKYGDGVHAGHFKAAMIKLLGVTHFLEDDPTQIEIIRKEWFHRFIVLLFFFLQQNKKLNKTKNSPMFVWLLYVAARLVIAEHQELFWAVQWSVASPDSYPRPIIVIKPQSQTKSLYDSIDSERLFLGGPTIYVQQYDTLHVHVTNRLSDRVVSIHWHGLHQKNNVANDGVPGVTQAGILPMHTFVYRLNITQEPGTHFYHSHSGLQSSDGFQGMFVIREKQQQQQEQKSVTVAEQQQQPVNDYVVALQDWHHELSTTLLAKYIARNGAYEGFMADYPYPAVSVLINGRGQFDCDTQFVSEQDCELVRTWGWPFVLSGYNESMRFAPKQTNWQTNGQCNPSRAPFVGACSPYTNYSEFVCSSRQSIKLRLVGSGFSLGLRFWIDGHNLTIVAKDGVPIYPVIEHQEAVFLHAGERIDVVVECNQSPRDYYMFAAVAYEYYGKTAHLKSPNVSSYAILHYDNAPNLQTIEAECPPDAWPQPSIQPIYFYPSTRHVAMPAKQQFFIWSQSKGHWWNYETNTSGKRLEWWELNSHAPWNLASVDSILDACTKDPNTNFSLLFSTQQQLPLIFNLVYNQTYDFVLVNNESQPHPWHVHGYSVDVLRVGAIRDMSTSLYNWNDTVENVMRADTFITPSKGFVQFRLVADNPGPWLVHCHMPYHAEVGMSFLLSIAYDDKSCTYQQPIVVDVAYWRDVSTAKIVASIVAIFVIFPITVAFVVLILGYAISKCRRKQHTLNAEYVQAIPLS